MGRASTQQTSESRDGRLRRDGRGAARVGG